MINLSLEEKKEIYADALEILKLEAHTKKTSSREDHQKNKDWLELLNQGKGAKIKAKELSFNSTIKKSLINNLICFLLQNKYLY